MKKTAVVAALAVAAWNSTAWGAGLGVSIQSGDPTVYLPFDINDSFRLEPYLSYSNDKTSTRVFDPPSPYTVQIVDEMTTTHLGVGAFWLAPIGESVRTYVGARFSYVSVKSEHSLDGGTRPAGLVFTPEEIKGDGLSFEPTIGLEYRFTERFSIAGEAKLVIASTELDDDRGSNDTTTTDTNVVARFRF